MYFIVYGISYCVNVVIFTVFFPVVHLRYFVLLIFIRFVLLLQLLGLYLYFLQCLYCPLFPFNFLPYIFSVLNKICEFYLFPTLQLLIFYFHFRTYDFILIFNSYFYFVLVSILQLNILNDHSMINLILCVALEKSDSNLNFLPLRVT